MKKRARAVIRAVLIAVVTTVIAGTLALWIVIPSCVVGGTLVLTPEGPRAIEELAVGDAVWCSGPGGPEVGRVTATHAGLALSHRLLRLSGGGALGVTDRHPVATAAGWTEAGELLAPQPVVGLSGPLHIQSVERAVGPVWVHDLSVEPHPNYFAAGVLVHNKRTRSAINESQAVAELRTLASAEAVYQTVNEGYYGMPECLVAPSSCLPDYPADGPRLLAPDGPWVGERSNYAFSFHPGEPVGPDARPEPRSPSSLDSWAALAVPVERGRLGRRAFCTDHTGMLCVTVEGPPPRVVDARCQDCQPLD